MEASVHQVIYLSLIKFCQEQAKEMEKQQIKNAYNDGHIDGAIDRPGLTSGTIYYNEIYGGGKL